MLSKYIYTHVVNIIAFQSIKIPLHKSRQCFSISLFVLSTRSPRLPLKRARAREGHKHKKSISAPQKFPYKPSPGGNRNPEPADSLTFFCKILRRYTNACERDDLEPAILDSRASDTTSRASRGLLIKIYAPRFVAVAAPTRCVATSAFLRSKNRSVARSRPRERSNARRGVVDSGAEHRLHKTLIEKFALFSFSFVAPGSGRIRN